MKKVLVVIITAVVILVIGLGIGIESQADAVKPEIDMNQKVEISIVLENDSRFMGLDLYRIGEYNGKEFVFLPQYALTRPGVASILCGYDTKQQVDEAIAYESVASKEKDYASVLSGAPLHSYRGECTYCGHCKPCVAKLDIAMINKYYDLATMQSKVPESVKSHYMLLGNTASECIGCKQCEARCPFGVKIAERMKKTAELFGK